MYVSVCHPSFLLCCVWCDIVQELEVKVEEWMARYEEDTEVKSKELEQLKVW